MKREQINRIIDLHLEEHAGVPSNRETLWESLGQWQLDSLVRLGLKPDDFLLDVGCGPLRFGTYAIPHLETGHYYGTEVWPPYLTLGERILQEFGIDKSYTMVIDPEFNFQDLGPSFDYVIAQSVVTHLSITQIERLLQALKTSTKKGATFLFTYNNNAYPYSVFYEMSMPMITPSNLTKSFFEDLATKFDISFSDEIPELSPHPTGQIAAAFYF